jgi:maltose/moltooligosaccharide transporter
MNKPRLSFWQIWNMSFGFLGIQFGWGLQLGQHERHLRIPRRQPDQIPILWLAAPLTGLIVQPIIGSMSDRTWNRIGRRRPYFPGGSDSQRALRCSSCRLRLALDGCRSALDSGRQHQHQHGAVPRFRRRQASTKQRTRGFVMQSVFIGLGADAAIFTAAAVRNLGVTGFDGERHSADGSSILSDRRSRLSSRSSGHSSSRSKEYPPEDIEAFKRQEA